VPRWIPNLFTGILLTVLAAVLGHAAEHAGWFHGLFHVDAVAECHHAHAHSDACGHTACHSHEAVPDLDFVAPTAPRLAQAECLACLSICTTLPPPSAPVVGLRPPDSSDRSPQRSGWSAGLSPLLV